MQKMTREVKENMCRMFVRGECIERVADEMQLDLQQVKHEYLQYIDLPLADKLTMTMLPEILTNRMHRLIDDVNDIKRIDTLLAAADEKTLVSLLDMKRKIKDRMRRDSASSEEARMSDAAGNVEIEEQLAEVYEKILAEEEKGDTTA
jgi:hypothetical protein